MSRRSLPLAVVVTLLTPALAHAATTPAFYKPASPLGGKRHGDLLRSRTAATTVALPGAARTDLLLYRGTGVSGKPVAVSGTVSLPKGKAPAGGWPIVSFAHGTTGLADQCAPSRPEGAKYSSYAYPTMTRWLKKGWAVARTDYEGLGTPGVHPFLVGSSEGRSVLDIVRAAHQRDARVSTKRVLLAGHSQGGHAALWAAALAKGYTPELGIRGTVGFAPESHTGEQAELISALKDPSGLTGLAASILAGIEVQHPGLKIAEKLTDKARIQYPKVLTECLAQITQPSVFGAIAPADLLKEGADTGPIVAALSANDTETLKITTPLRVEQGAADTTVFPVFTDQLVDALSKRGTKVTYTKRPGVNHVDILAVGTAGATTWMARQLAR